VGLAEVKQAGMGIDGIKEIHHIHIWAMSTTENALTAHVILDAEVDYEQEQKIKDELKHLLAHENIHHVTLETKRETESSPSKGCGKCGRKNHSSSG